MNSRKNPSVVFSLTSASLSLLFLGSGCASLFSRSPPEAENAGENRYSANETADSSDDSSRDPKLKEQKIQSLESTVLVLNSRIQELEGKLQASQNRPNVSEIVRHASDGSSREESAGASLSASIASNDPGAGFVNDTNVRAFQQGKVLFDQEKFPEAILAFSAFLERNEKHALAGAAQYWIGESYFQQGDFSVASLEFHKLLVKYPFSSRVSYALVRLSTSQEKLGKMDEARKYRLQAEGLFPRSPAIALLGSQPSARISPNVIQTELQNDSSALPPIATAPDSEGAPMGIAIERPIVPTIETPRVEMPVVETPRIETPTVETSNSHAPRAPVNFFGSSSDLDSPPSMGGGG